MFSFDGTAMDPEVGVCVDKSMALVLESGLDPVCEIDPIGRSKRDCEKRLGGLPDISIRDLKSTG